MPLPELDDFSELDDVPAWMKVWGHAVETVLSAVYFLLISLIAVAIDLGLHWFLELPVVKHYGLSGIIRWEIELMAYTLATIDCFLFMRRLIQPIVEFVARVIRHES